MHDHIRAGVLCGLAVLTGLASGCSPTYRTGQLAQAIEQICATEHQLTISVRQIGRTVAVQLHRPGILQQEGTSVGLSESATEVLGNVLEAVHRVIFSSEDPVQFYFLLVSDPTVPGVYLTLIRHVEDVRRANANVIPPTELLLPMLMPELAVAFDMP